MSEAEVQRQVVALLLEAGASPPPYHTHDSRRSEPGFPDVVAVVGRVVWAVECKTSTGKLSGPQTRWLNALAACHGVRVFLATPETLDDLRVALGLGREPRVTEYKAGQPCTRRAEAEELGPRVLRAYEEQYRGG